MIIYFFLFRIKKASNSNHHQQSTATSAGLIPIPSRRKAGHQSSTTSTATTTTTTTTASASSNASNIHNYYAIRTGAAATANPSTTSTTTTATPSQPKITIDHSIINANKEKVHQWILSQAKQFKQTYFGETTPIADKVDSSSSAKKSSLKTESNGLDVLEKLKSSVSELDQDSGHTEQHNNERFLKALKKISNILHETDISSFEMIHSGLIEKLLTFLSAQDETSVKKYCFKKQIIEY